MRIELFLLTPLEQWGQITPKMAKMLTSFIGPRIIDIVFHVPTSLVNRQALTYQGRVLGHKRPRAKKAPHVSYLQLKNSLLRLVFFHRSSRYIESLLPPGEMRVVSGPTIKHEDFLETMVNPDKVLPIEKSDQILMFEPVYPCVKGLKQSSLHHVILAIFDHWHMLEKSQLPCEWWSDAFLKKHGWPTFREALYSLHRPQSQNALHSEQAARLRLCCDEWLFEAKRAQIANAFQKKCFPLKPSETFWQQRIKGACIQPTNSQKEAISHIKEDIVQKNKAMLRLLQGDVGSGKTLVAEWLLLAAVENGVQAAFMAPTEILAQQHYATLLKHYPTLSIGLFTQGLNPKIRKKMLEDLKNGQLQIVVGTHALFQKDIFFQALGACVIDEQHRFGVQQRQTLIEKNYGNFTPHTLLMSATPIPRTLSLALYGSIDMSILGEKPQGRGRVQTAVLPLQNSQHVAKRLLKYMENNAKRAYWVCPLIEESKLKSLTAVEERVSFLRYFFGEKLGILHGRMTSQEKERAIGDFSCGKTTILLSTSVIEVGLHVPEACVMVIEHAEHFGLAQLHQLRGRIGRSQEDSFCILLYQEPLSFYAKERLKLLRSCHDGFLLAQKDLNLRGGGEKLGIRQTGAPSFFFIDLESPQHQALASLAQAALRQGAPTEILEKLFTREKLTAAFY